MTVLKHAAALRDWRAQQTDVAFVPTMGNLHAGHLSLVKQAQTLAEKVLVSIFVNPLQFGPQEDFSRYPRTLDADLELLARAGVDAVFTPTVNDLYPVEQSCFIELPALAGELCGRSRPGHFRGVATVVMKLFHLAQPAIACFGKKDYQQLTVIRMMTEQFLMPIRIVGGETVRAPDGLALSSRNQYLNPAERAQAPQLYAELHLIAQQLQHGARDYKALEMAATHRLESSGWQVDYINVRNPALVIPAPDTQHWVVLSAARLGQTRLIDNLEVI